MNIGSVSASNSNVQKIGTVAFSIAKEAARFSKKFSEEIAEKSREYSQSTQLYDKYYVDVDAMKELLDSKYDAEKVEGLKRAIGFIAKGRDCSALFPSVVKNVAVQNMEVKRLVYDYLIYYANKEQELALLAVNTFQKELSDKNPEVRALAIKVMSSSRIPAIMPILLQGIKQSIRDDSILVRQAAVNSIIKCYQMNPENKPVYVDYIELGLKDSSPYVIGCVVNAFNKICPERLDLIHPHFRRLCYVLIDVDSWGQLAILDLLLSYARGQLESPFKNAENNNQNNNSNNEQYNLDSFYKDNGTLFNSENTIDSDLRLLLDYVKPILQSYNIAVVLKIVTLFYYLAPRKEFNNVALTLLRFISKNYEQQYIILQNILTITRSMPDIYKYHIKYFFINNEDPYYIKDLKMKILMNLTDVHNSNTVYNEFYSYIRNEDPKLVVLTMEAISSITKKLPVLTEIFLRLLLSKITSKNDQVSAECIIVIRKLLKLYPEDNSNIIKYLAKILPNITVPKAKANLLWLIGQYCQSIIIFVPDILRTFAKQFTKEELQVKYQILNLAAKLASVDPQPKNLLLFEYVLKLARYDINYDLRDKARFYKALVLDQIRKFIPNEDKTQNKKNDDNNKINDDDKIKDTKEDNTASEAKDENKKEEEEEEKEKDKEESDLNTKPKEEEEKDEDEEDKIKLENDKDEISLDENSISMTSAPFSSSSTTETNVLNSKSLEELLSNLQKLLISNNISIVPNSSNINKDQNEKYTLGTLSHSVNYAVKGYEPLPDWPETALNVKSRQEFIYQCDNEHAGKSFSSKDKRFQNISEIPSRSFSGGGNSSVTPSRTTTTSAPKRYVTLDEFYNTTDDDDDDDDDEEEETEESEEEDDDDEETEDDEDEDEDEDDDDDDDDDDDEESEDEN
jgi:vesicle coat complex subunit